MIKRFFVIKQGEKVTAGVAAFNYALLIFSFAAFLFLTFKRLGLSLDFTSLVSYKTRFLQGFSMTVLLSVFSLAVSLIIGFATAIGNRSSLIFVSYACKSYVQLIRGTPLLVQIYLFFYIIGTSWGIDNRYFAGVIILSVFEGAYISEIIRGGMESIENSQMEIAKSIGLTKNQAFLHIVLPQLMTRILPSLTGQFASIIKDSSLLSLIAVNELSQSAGEISSSTYRLFETYFLLGLLYFLLTYPLFIFTKKLERKFSYED